MAKFLKDTGSLGLKKKKKDPDDAAVGVYKLPQKKTAPVADLLGYITLLFGEKKIGKTSMLAEADDTFFAFFEPGGKALELYADVFSTWSMFKQAVNQLVAEKPRRFNHVVIDTVDLAYKSASRAALRKLGIEHEGDAGFGKGWAAVRDEFEQPIMKLVNSGIAVTFVSHATEAEIEMRDGSKFTKIISSMPKQARSLVEGLVDIWAYYGYDGDKRVLYIEGNEDISAGHRLVNHFRTPDGKPVKKIDMGGSPAEAWKRLNDAFHNRYTPIPTKKEGDATGKPTKKVFAKVKA